MPDGAGARARRLEFFGAPGTYLLVGINCAVFLWMVLHGVSVQSPTPNDLVRFGANNAGLVLNHGEWYRLLTATFVHVGWIHLATNMWCLWNLGMLGEPLLGPFGLVAVYLLTGVAGNLLSTAVNLIARNYGSVGAGASGAVFGSGRNFDCAAVESAAADSVGGAAAAAAFGDSVRGAEPGDWWGVDLLRSDPDRQYGASGRLLLRAGAGRAAGAANDPGTAALPGATEDYVWGRGTAAGAVWVLDRKHALGVPMVFSVSECALAGED